jgi:hypothetical protein
VRTGVTGATGFAGGDSRVYWCAAAHRRLERWQLAAIRSTNGFSRGPTPLRRNRYPCHCPVSRGAALTTWRRAPCGRVLPTRHPRCWARACAVTDDQGIVVRLCAQVLEPRDAVYGQAAVGGRRMSQLRAPTGR